MPQSKADKIAEVQANLPLPDQPPTASDWQSADARNVKIERAGNKGRGHGYEWYWKKGCEMKIDWMTRWGWVEENIKGAKPGRCK